MRSSQRPLRMRLHGSEAGVAGQQALQLEYRRIRKERPLRPRGAQCLDDLHQIIERFERVSRVGRGRADPAVAGERMQYRVIRSH